MNLNGASIQVEDGNWSKLHNHIWNALAAAPLSGAEFRCLMFLFRQTYGWQKKQDTISMGQWATATKLERRSVIRTVQGLLAKKVIYRIDNGERKPATWGFNKYVETWQLTADGDSHDTSVPSDQNDTSDETDTRTSDQNDTKASDQNDTHKRELKKKKESSPDDALALVNLIRASGFIYLDNGAIALATQLIEAHGWERCAGGIEKVKAEHQKKARAGRRGIVAPLAYLRSILDEQKEVEAESIKGFESNAWERLATNTPDYMKG